MSQSIPMTMTCPYCLAETTAISAMEKHVATCPMKDKPKRAGE